MSKRKPPSMTLAQFGALKGVSRQAVRAAIERGDIPPAATLWAKRGRQKVLMIVDVPLASKSWTPPAEQPLPPSGEPSGKLDESTSLAEAKRLMAIARAKQANLEFDQQSKKLVALDEVMHVFGTHIVQIRNAFMGLGTKLQGLIPHLTRDDAFVVQECVREILTDLADGAQQAKATVLKESGRK